MANTQRINALAAEHVSDVSLQFKYISNELKEMGFEMSQVHNAILLSNTTTVDAALEYLIKEPNGWMHPFIPTQENPLICKGCGESPSEHAGNAVQQEQINPIPPELLRSPFASMLDHEVPESSTMCDICYENYGPVDIVTLPC